jgi:hypothetical protein
MARKRGIYALAVVVLVGLTAGSLAVGKSQGPGDPPDKKTFKASLNGYQEVNSISTTGWGELRMELVEPEKLHFVLNYGGLEGTTTTAAHVHFAQRSVNGAVVFFFCGGGTKPDPCPAGGGIVEGDVTPADIVGLAPGAAGERGIANGEFAEVLRAMQAGHSYANVHTNRWGGGEIRGQVNDNDQKEFTK